MDRRKIAFLGSTSHIAKGLITSFLQSGEFVLHLYTRSPDKARLFLCSLGRSASEEGCAIHEGYGDFLNFFYDIVINCTGVGTAKKHRNDFTLYFTVTEEYDNLVIGYLLNNPNALYISFSSGAVYGKGHSTPVEEDSENRIRVNHVASEDYYAIVRLNAEAKHRAFTRLNIVDLRVFSYFSRFIDLQDGYFITDVIDCIIKNNILFTDSSNIVRDYLHPEDLFSIILRCIEAERINTAFDVNSLKPVAKQEILDYFALEYGLEYKVSTSLSTASATGFKSIYCSMYNAASRIGYMPRFTSIDTIIHESKHILEGVEPQSSSTHGTKADVN